MRQILMPNLYVNHLTDIPLDTLREQGKEGLILDLDNTVTEWNSMIVRDDVASWVKQAVAMGFRLCLLSNNSHERVFGVARTLDVPFVFKAGKPRRRAYVQALKLLGLTPDRAVVIGDQIFTDVFGGNRVGVYTILVTPLARREFIGTRFMRRLERPVLRRLKKHEEE